MHGCVRVRLCAWMCASVCVCFHRVNRIPLSWLCESRMTQSFCLFCGAPAAGFYCFFPLSSSPLFDHTCFFLINTETTREAEKSSQIGGQIDPWSWSLCLYLSNDGVKIKSYTVFTGCIVYVEGCAEKSEKNPERCVDVMMWGCWGQLRTESLIGEEEILTQSMQHNDDTVCRKWSPSSSSISPHLTSISGEADLRDGGRKLWIGDAWMSCSQLTFDRQIKSIYSG